MGDIAKVACDSIAGDRAIREVASEGRQEKDEEIKQKTHQLISQIQELHSLLTRADLDKSVEEISRRRLLGQLPFLPRSLSWTKKGDSRKGWRVAEVNVVVPLRWWRRVGRRLKIGRNRQKSPTVMGSQGVLLLTDDTAPNKYLLYKYFRLEIKNWIVITDKYEPEKELLPKFKAPPGGLFSRFPDKHINARRWAASLEAGMFTLAKDATLKISRSDLERKLPDGVVPKTAVDEALFRLRDRDGLQAFLDIFSPAELMDLIKRMNPAIGDIPVATDQIGQDPACVALPVLLDLLPRLPEDAGPLHVSGTMTVMQAARRLLQRIPDQNRRTDVISAVLGDTRTLSGRLILLLVAGHRKDIGNGLLDASVATELEDQLRDDLVARSAAEFAVESRTIRFADLMAETEKGRVALRDLAEDNRVMLSLFVGSAGETRAQAIGAAAEVTKVLAWDRLALYFGEDTLIRRTAELVNAVRGEGMAISPEEQAALDLAVGLWVP